MGSMVGTRLPHRLILGLLTALAVLTIALPAGAPPVAARSGWDGSFDLYRRGTFTTQKSWLWCTAAGVQIVRNIVERDDDHSTASQRRYFEWMRHHNRYDLPLSAGVDAAGWTAGMRHFVDDRYRLVVSTSFDGALRLAVKRMRLTNLPVALTVDHANHAWILTGFSANADPATTDEFRVTSVRVVGPLYGLQSRTYGYDMKPGTSLTTKQLRHFFTPWWYVSRRMIWDHKYVSIQPVPVKAAATTPKRTLSAIASPSPSSIASPSIAASLEDPSSSPFDAAAVILPVTDGSADGAQTGPVRPPRVAPTSPVGEVESGVVVAVVGLLVAVAVGLGLIARNRPAGDRKSQRRSTRSVP